MRLLIALCCCLLLALPAAARSWLVGPDGQPGRLSDALRDAADGDLIELKPGRYVGEHGVLRQRRLTLRGLGERPELLASGPLAEDKAILVVKHGDIVIENIGFRGARTIDRNGAGIRFERGRLLLRRCAFFDNEKGLMTSNVGDAELIVEDSWFGDGARVDRNNNHLLYVGAIASVSVRGSRFHRGATGHLFKSRAARTWLGYNLFVDGPQGIASYEVDLPNGGDATLIGNVIAQGPGSENRVVVAYGAEGRRWPLNRLRLSHNTLINELLTPAWFLRVWHGKLPADTEVLALNNLLLGGGVFELGVRGRFDGNRSGSRELLLDPDALDFALQPGARWRGSAVEPQRLGAAELVPDAEFQLPIGTRPLVAPAGWSPGALQR